jgi:hypothetical protein
VPTVRLSDPTEAESSAYVIADKLAENAGRDRNLLGLGLGLGLKYLSEL